MNLKHLLAFLVGLYVLAGCTRPTPFPDGQWVDLTYDFSDQTIYWPTDQHFKLTEVFGGRTPKGYFYHSNQFLASEHGGTHADAPIHFTESGITMERLPIEQFIGPAVVVDVRAQVQKDRDYQVKTDDLKKWEAAHGRIPGGSILLIQTGYGPFWPRRQEYLGTELRGPEGVAQLHFPGLSAEGAQWLVANRKCKAIGIETASIDFGQSKLFETHQVLCNAGVAIIENVARLERLPPKGAYIVALPMKIKGGTGAPVRIAALLPK